MSKTGSETVCPFSEDVDRFYWGEELESKSREDEVVNHVRIDNCKQCAEILEGNELLRCSQILAREVCLGILEAHGEDALFEHLKEGNDSELVSDEELWKTVREYEVRLFGRQRSARRSRENGGDLSAD